MASVFDLDQPERLVEHGELTLRIGEDDGTYLVKLSGELDLNSVGMLRDEFDRVGESHPSSLLVDLSELTFIDSSGLAAFVRLHRWAAAEGCSLKLVQGGPAVERVFELTGLAGELPFVAASSA